MAELTEEKRKKMPASDFAGGGTNFPVGDSEHARLAIGGATHSYNAGNISKAKEEEIKATARERLVRYKSPRSRT